MHGVPPPIFLFRFCGWSRILFTYRLYFSPIFSRARTAARGSLATDVVSIGPFTAVSTFGRITNTTAQQDGPPFEPDFLNGIFGVAFESLNCLPSCMPTVLDSFVQRGVVDAVYGMCLTETGGVWDLGALDEQKYAPNAMAWLPIVADTYFTVPNAGVVLRTGSTQIKLPHSVGQETIFDSGTTLLIGPDDWFASFQGIMETNFGSLPGFASVFTNDAAQCVQLTDAQIAQYPTLDFAFTTVGGGVATASVSPGAYLLSLDDAGRTCTRSGIVGGSPLFILGDVFLQNFYVAYDTAQRRVGFAPVTACHHELVPPTSEPTVAPPTTAGAAFANFFQHTGLVVGALACVVVVCGVGYYVGRRITARSYTPALSLDGMGEPLASDATGQGAFVPPIVSDATGVYRPLDAAGGSTQ